MAKAEKKKVAHSPEKDAVDLLLSISRVMARVAKMEEFESHGLGMTEWLFLNQVSEADDAKSGAIGARVGVTPQRAGQIVDELVFKNLISASASEKDGRKKDLKITSVGSSKIGTLNKAVAQHFATLKSTAKAAQVMRVFSRSLVKETRPEKAAV